MKPVTLFSVLIATLLVAACGGGGSSSAPSAPPAVPSNLLPVAGDKQVQLSWSSVPEATSYNIYYQASANASKSSTEIVNAVSGQTISGLADGTTYYFAVTAVDAYGESSLSNQVSATPLPPVPGAPAGVAAVAGDSQVQISWSSVTGAVSYNVYYSTTQGVTTTNGIRVANAVSGSTITGLSNGTTYYFVVTAVDTYGQESAISGVVSALPSAPPPPTAPTGLTAIAGDSQVALNWAAVSGATSYNAYYSTTAGVTTTNGTKVANAVSGAAITGLTNGTTYYFVVTAVDAYGESLLSNQVSAVPLPAVPAAPTGVAAVAGDMQAQINWAAVTGATSYNIYYSTAPGVTTNGSKIANATPGTSITGLSNGTAYYFVVTSVDAYGQESTISSSSNATPAVWTTSATSTPAGPLADINQQRDNAANTVVNIGGVNRIYVMGGAPAGSSILNSMEMDSPPFTGTWTVMAPMPAWSTFSFAPAWGGTAAPPDYRYSPAAATYNGLIYLVGGTSEVDGEGPIYPIAVYNPGTNSWSNTVPANTDTTAAGTAGQPLAPLPTGRWGFDIAVIDGKLYAVGGSVHVPGNITMSSASKITGATSTAPVVNPAGTTITLINANHYYFFVTSVDGSGVESVPSSMVSALINGVDSSIAGNGQAALSWAPVTGATSYNLYYSTKPGVMPADASGAPPPGVTAVIPIATTATATAVSTTVTGLSNGTPYYFIATAVTPTGEVMATDQEISVIPESTSSISGLNVISGNGQATLSWTPVPGAASYNIYYDTGNNFYYGTVEMYDPVANTWASMATMPTPRWGPTVVVVNGIIYAIGGWGGWPELSVVEAYDPAANTWSTTVPTNTATTATGSAGQPLAKMPTARDDFGFSVMNGKIFAIGGDTNTFNDATSTPCCTQVVQAYDTVNNTWTNYPMMPTMRDDFDASMVDGSIYAIAGSRDGVFTVNPAAPNNGGYSLTTVEALSTSSIPVPTGVTATTSTGQVALSWNQVTGASTYRIYWSNKAGVSTAISTADGNVIGNISTTAYTHSGLTAGSWYYYVVTAVTASGESLPSNEVAVRAQ